ncbi:uncharacterized protein CTRU02_206960 [Colletotrichum truncatum]|uniref:Uncharacterized protein n=1 Tax=Colletotrichum truncatum TaxID=5467 RepID=A0ACC3YZ92_COLTU|nr:uncharacterized protein CTRU02_11186 [Colletotrichum truncatum]KAF6786315.1 hypothetical protein CTRU02_11186 [Colletotrichum truncatum]
MLALSLIFAAGAFASPLSSLQQEDGFSSASNDTSGDVLFEVNDFLGTNYRISSFSTYNNVISACSDKYEPSGGSVPKQSTVLRS